METKLNEINVTLSKNQKEKIIRAYLNREKISLDLKNDALYGNDTLLVPEKSIIWIVHNNQFVSDKEPFPEYFAWNGCPYMLCKETFSEMLDNGFMLIPSINDEGLKNFRLYTPPTVVERLEKAREHNMTYLEIFLDYSLLNNSNSSINFPVFKNVGKMIEKFENDGKFQ